MRISSAGRKILTFLIFLILILKTFKVESQIKSSIFIEDKIYTGFVVNNFLRYDSFPKISPALINELKIGHKTLGAKNWHQFYNYPEVAISIFEGSLGNKKQFGNITGILPNINFVLKSSHNNLKLSLGWGIAYFNRPYDSIDNPHNILIGSHITHFASITMYYELYLNNNFYIDLSGAYLHASNGHYQIPNGGMNLGTVSLGVKKYFKKTEHSSKLIKSEKREKKDIYLKFGLGVHEFAGTLYPTGTPKYKIYTVTALFSWNYKPFIKYFIGFTGKYYEAFKTTIVNENLYPKNIVLKSSILTFVLGNEFQFGNFAIYTYGGLNVYTPFVLQYVYKKDHIYNIDNILEVFISSKLGMRYYFFNPQTSKRNFFISWAIKANFGNADFTELSAGFVL